MGATVSYYAALPFALLHYGLCHIKPNVFVLMLEGKIPVNTVYEDDKVIVIKDKFPAADHHLLVIPRELIKAWTSLTKSHAALVEHMVEAGREAIKREGWDEEGMVFGFMTPPFNSQMQLHMHCISQPLRIKGPRGWAMASDQFVTAEDVLSRLA